MFRKVLLLVMALLSLPTFASAFTYWSVSATSSPAALSSQIKAVTSADVALVNGTTFNVIANTASEKFTVAAAPLGFALSYVAIDGVQVQKLNAKGVMAPDLDGPYTVTKGTKLNHTLVATYASQKFPITTSKTGLGIIDPTVSIPSGTGKVISMTAAPGYQIASVTQANGSALPASVTFTGDTNSRAYTFSNVTAPQTILANFTVIPVSIAKIATPSQTIALGSRLLVDGSTSISSGGSFAWTGAAQTTAVTPAVLPTQTMLNGTPAIPAGQAALFTATAVGTFPVTLTLTSGTASSQATINVTVTSQAAIDAAVCTSCHTAKNPKIVGDYTKSVNNNTNACQACHVGDHGASVATAQNDFFSSPHWTSATGHEDAAGFVAAGHGSVAACAQTCHFNQGAVTSCNVCHSDGMSATGTFVNASSVHRTPKGNVAGTTATNSANTCMVCHEGGRHGVTTTNWTNSTHNMANNHFEQIDCAACHNPHSTVATATDGKTDSCGVCHLDKRGQFPGAGNYSIYTSASMLVLKAPHGGGKASTATGSVNNGDAKTQYISQGAICIDCHGHNNTINAGYAESAHGAVSDDALNPFSHYDWKARQDAYANATVWGSRQNGNCNRCHTTYGFLKFTNQTTGLTRLQLKNGQQNVLLCITCHSTPTYDATQPGVLGMGGTGSLRMPEGTLSLNAVPNGSAAGALKNGYFALFSSAATAVASGKTKIQISFPGYKSSSICIPCHSGRSTAAVFVAVIDQAKLVNKNYTTISTSYYQHGKNVAQTFINQGGYDFTGKLATVAANGHAKVKNGPTDSQGPCVGCHYSSDKTHSLEPTGYAVCNVCHLSGLGASDVAAAKANFDAGVAILDTLIRAKFAPLQTKVQGTLLEEERVSVRFGRFGKAPGALADDTTAKKAYGAWYNWQILTNYDKAAYVHNPAYASQLLNDTGDYLLNPTGAYGGQTFKAYITAQQVAGAISAATAANALAFTKEVGCLGCHANSTDPNSGNPIMATYDASGHSNSGHGPTCVTCHNPVGGTDHSSMQKGYAATGANGAGGACISCHNGVYSRSFGGATHFTNATSATFHNVSAAYVGYKGKGINVCATCHFKFDPHTIGAANETEFTKNSDILAAWAESGHGDRSGAAWIPSASHDWRNSGTTTDFSTTIPSTDCVRCHTAAGFTQFATSGFKNVNNVGAADGQRFNSPLTCAACHAADASGSVTAARLPAAAVSTFYNISTVDKVSKKTVKSRIAANFPDVGESNLCIGCHAARVAGPNLADLANSGNWDLTNASFQNSHYMAAAGTMYMKAGFKNFTTLTAPAATNNEGAAFASNKTYNQTLTAVNTTTPDGVAGGQNSAHRRLGTPLITGSEDYLTASLNPLYVSGALETNGPCVTCHLQAYKATPGNGFTPPAKRPGAGHSLQIDEATAEQLCLQCHADAPHLDGGDGMGNATYTTMTSLADMEAAMLEPQRSAFQNGLSLVKQLLLVKYQIKYDSANYPYFFDMQKDAAGKTAVTDWTRKKVAGLSNAAVLAFGSSNLTVIPTGGLTQTQAYRLMGACYNLNVLARDPGAYLHARTYTQRLVYDTVDYLDDNLMDFSALSSARLLNPTVYKGTNVNVFASDGTLATESMAWLAGTHYTDGSIGNTLKPLKLRP